LRPPRDKPWCPSCLGGEPVLFRANATIVSHETIGRGLVLFFCIFSCYGGVARLFLRAANFPQVADGQGLFLQRMAFFARIFANGLYLPVKQEDDPVTGTKGEGGGA
jgi:hypothetical protein